MNNEEITFEEFLAGRIKDKGFSIKRLADATGIAPTHLEILLRGDLEDMPSAPYFRGYLLRIGKLLDFDGEEWWQRIKEEGLIRNSGPSDVMPENRFERKKGSKTGWIIGGVAAIVIIYLLIMLPRIMGKPVLTVSFPSENPYVSSSTTVTIQGTVQNADSLYLNNNESVIVSPDGSWQKTVLLSENEPNTFQFTAKKFLGGATSITRVILYGSAGTSTSSSTSGGVSF